MVGQERQNIFLIFIFLPGTLLVNIACWVRYKNHELGGRGEKSRDIEKLLKEPRAKGQSLMEVFFQ